MAEPALAYPQTPPPCPALNAILAHDEYSLPETDGLPLADGRVQQIPLPDPTRRRDARILGLRLHAGEYEDMPYEELPDGSSGVRSDTTGLVAYVNDSGELRWFDPVSGQDLRSYEEVQNQVNETESEFVAAKAQTAELDAAKAQIAELQAQVRRLSGEV